MKGTYLSLIAILLFVATGCGKVDLEINLPSFGEWFSLSNGAEFVAASQKSVTTPVEPDGQGGFKGGYIVNASLGAPFGELESVTTTDGGYKVYSSVEGQIVSEAIQLEIQAKYQ